MRVGGNLSNLYLAETPEDLVEAVKDIQRKDQRLWVIGSGSNSIFTGKGFSGGIIRYTNQDLSYREVDEGTLVTVGAGKNWDGFVAETSEKNLSGIELLSMIPGDCGATPVQNIGAYGQQISDVFVSLTALDLESLELVTIDKEECGFGYRTSIFKNVDKKRYIIVDITLLLSKKSTLNGELYKDIELYLEKNSITERGPSGLRAAVMDVRSKKLPDPKKTPNSGSFFKNPIVSAEQKNRMVNRYPELDPWTSKIFGKTSQGFWLQENGSYKVAAGMLMEHAGFADHIDPESGFGTWPTQALCIINPNENSAENLQIFVDKITTNIREMHDIELEIEPEFIS